MVLVLSSTILFSQKFGFESVLSEKGDKIIPFSLENTAKNATFLKNENIKIKQTTENWIYFSATASWINNQFKAGKLEDFYFEYNPPVALDDTARVLHNVNKVHDGESPLLTAYTGKGVIIGVIDQGLDHNHPDFIDQNGNTRVLRYWDQSITNPTQSPSPYNYGQIWYESQINSGTITSNEETSGHGTTVTGIAAGNGTANGRNKGMAPEADIIVVETNFSLGNWSLTVADACDFIFNVADSLNKPAVINLSVGSYLGSHDGEDPAAELIDDLLDEKNGRLVVCAAGNSGNKDPYHVSNQIDNDTSFVWFENNPNGNYGNNTILFDLWTDEIEADFYYSFGANLPSGSYANRASTQYRYAQNSLSNTIYDTIRNQNGDQIATLEIETEIVGDNYHMIAFFSSVDSTSYRYRFSTTGSGSYDLWSGQFIGFNKVVNTIPSPADYPPIINYVMPDTLQSIVSSWNCSPKVVSVGNLRNRLGHIDKNGDQYYPSDMTLPGHLAPSSSKGPTRKGVIKPDVSASGDVTLASGPAWILNNPGMNSVVDDGGYHVRNGGTSMASPTVAGIAALYLERCGNSNWNDFKNDLFPSSTSDSITGVTPNLAYGYGKVDAFELLKKTNGNLQLLGDSVICQQPILISSNETLNNYNWSDGSNSSSIYVTTPSVVFLSGTNDQGCELYSDTMEITQGSPLENPAITILGGSLIATNAPNYQWFLNDVLLPGDTNQVIYPDSEGYYSVAITSEAGCSSFSNGILWTLSLSENETNNYKVYPNPTKDNVNISSENQIIEKIRIYSIEQKLILERDTSSKNEIIDVSNLSSGTYILEMSTKTSVKSIKFLKE
ncbi:MAG: S8/S53 family peptidase [Brumimicrobium sp.]